MDEKFVEALREAGLSRLESKVLGVLVNEKECTSRYIERSADMRQPEVTVAMKTLRGYGWISTREIKRVGKGRPEKAYSLNLSVDKIVDQIAGWKKRELRDTQLQIQKLRSYL